MELTQMKYFLEVAKTLHMTNTAKKLHIAQPALSQSIRRLEKELGVSLFVLKGRNIILTPYGVYLKERLEPILNELDSVEKDMDRMINGENNIIRVNVAAASTFVTKVIIEYKKLNPDISFYVMQSDTDTVADIDITTKLFYDHTENENSFVCTEKIFLAVPDTEKYQNRTSIALSEVKDEGFISLFGSKQLRSICDKFCNRAGFEPNIIFESDSPYAVKNMIAANLGVGFWPEFTWGKAENDSVHILEIIEPSCQRDIQISCRKTKIDNSNVENFYRYMIDYFKTMKKKY